MTLSNLQIARLVQTFLAEPGTSVEEKAVLVGVRRNQLLRAARGAISRTTRLRLLTYFGTIPARRAAPRPAATIWTHRQRNRGFT